MFKLDRLVCKLRKGEISMNKSRHKGLALILLAVSQLILALDYTIVFVAMPSIGADLGFSANHLQWVVSAYSLVFGGFLLIGGRLSDLMGRRRMFIIAIALFGSRFASWRIGGFASGADRGERIARPGRGAAVAFHVVADHVQF